MQNIREKITNRIIEALEAGTPPWRQGWKAVGSHHNSATGKAYKGANALLLGMSGFTDNRWLTLKQANALKSEDHPNGLRVRKGEKATMLVRMVEVEKYADNVSPVDGELVAEDKKTRLVMKAFHVFNASQIEGMPPQEEKPVSEFPPNESVEQIIAGLKADGLILLHGGDKACFTPRLDTIRMPVQNCFVSADDYFSTLLHEAAHATGTKNRLDRFGLFGHLSNAEAYAREELRAEIGSMLVGNMIGVAQSRFHEENHHAYIGSWIQALKSDKNELFKAAGAAQSIADWLISHAIQPEAIAAVELESPQATPTDAIEPAAPRRRMRM